MPASPPWIAKPAIDLHRESGDIVSAFVKLRDAPPAYTVQPSEECLVFLHLGRDHGPVSIEFLEPVPGRLAFAVMARLVESKGHPVSVGIEPAHEFVPLTSEEIAHIAKVMGQVQERLESTPA